MKIRMSLSLVAALLFVGCSGGNESSDAEAVPENAAPAATPDSMPGMNHDNMPGMNHDSMPGMDHSNMPGMTGDSASGEGAGAMDHDAMSSGEGGMEEMDHSRMSMAQNRSGGSGSSDALAAMDHSQMGHIAPATPSRSAQPMDHSRMPGMANQTEMPHGDNMQGMQHGNMNMPEVSGTESVTAALPADEGTEKLLALIRELVQDPAVQQQIQQDPALRAAWADPEVRRFILNRL